MTGRNHEHFNLNGGMPQGVGYVVRPAKDPIAREPEDDQIRNLLKKTLCRARLHEGQWEVTSVIGKIVRLEFSASFLTWKSTCESLLVEAVTSES